MRRGHTEAAQVPIKLARAWMRHPAHELNRIANLELNVDGVNSGGGESGVVNVRGQRMSDWTSHNPKNFCPSINLVNSIDLAQLSRGQLPGRSRTLIIE